MLVFIDHSVEENIYIVVALIDFFCAVTENGISFTPISFSDITSFVCQNNPFLEDLQTGIQKIPRKVTAPRNHFHNLDYKRDIDAHPPIVLSKIT